ncbi:MAG: glycosyltransferase family 2 protein [Bacteroidota bacterium]
MAPSISPNVLGPALASPVVSIGLPVYNGERFLGQTLEDFCAQTFGDFELVIVDNASTDATPDIAHRYALRDMRIRYVRNEANIGSLPNFNRAFRLSAPAPYFAWAAHDDRHSPDFLGRLLALLEADPTASLAYGRAVYIDDDEEVLPYDDPMGAFLAPDGMAYNDDRALEDDIDGLPSRRFERVLLSTMLNTPIHGVFRRSVLEKSSLHHFYGSDTLLLAEAALAGPFRFADDDLFRWRLHPAGTAYMTREQWAERETGIEGFRPKLPLRSLPRYLRAVARAGLGPVEATRAYAAVARYVLRADKLKRTFVPGPDNYLGLRRWPWRPETQSAAPTEAAHS